MTVERISRTGKTYYLHVKMTAAGKPNYFFSMDAGGPLAESVPEGYEVYENMGGQVFLRKKTAQPILPAELARVEAALLKHGESWKYRAEVKKNAIVIHEAGNMAGLDEMVIEFRRRPLSASEKAKHASYMAVLRFVLADKKTRAFVTERFCFCGSVDDWIYIGGPGTLSSQLSQFVKHLGRESIYELF